MLGNKYKTGLCPCTCWWLRRHLRKTCRFFKLFRNTSFKLWCYAVCVKIAGMLIGYRQFSQSNCLQLFFGINSPRVGRAWKTDLAMRWTCTRVFSGHTHVIDAGTSAVVVAPGNGVVCWRAQTAALWAGSKSWRGSTFFRVVAYSIFFEHKVQKQAPAFITS